METKLDLEAVRHLFASLARNCEKYGVQLNSVRFKRNNDTGQLNVSCYLIPSHKVIREQ